MTTSERTLTIKLPRPFAKQEAFLRSDKKRKVLRCGRRGGKTVGLSILAVEKFLQGKRVLYAAPTADQVNTFWREVCRALAEPIEAGIFKKNETEKYIELPGTEQRIKAKTAWNADTLRGDYADVLILDEWQMQDENAWGEVGAPMLLDNGGEAIFSYTPPSVRSRSVSKAKDKMHAAKLFKSIERGERGPNWEAFHWTSHDNPTLNREALEEITSDMTRLAYRQEILAEDIEEVPGALWKQSLIDENRRPAPPIDRFIRVVTAIDPAGKDKQSSDETGICVGGLAHCDCGKGRTDQHVFILDDLSGRYSPDGWARKAIGAHEDYGGDRVIAEVNNGGDMVTHTLRTVDPNVPVLVINASRGKRVRAEPTVAADEQGIVHHTRVFPELEEQMVNFTGDDGNADDRVDSRVYVVANLTGNSGRDIFFGWAN